MKAPNALPDIQLSLDSRDIALDAVGIRSLKLPLRLKNSDGEVQLVTATWEAGVSLAAELRGTHMSRFVTILQDFGSGPLTNLDLSGLVQELQKSLQCRRVELKVAFDLFLERSAPVSGLGSQLSVPLCLAVTYGSEELKHSRESIKHMLSLEVPAANLCPCSKAISENGAHNQRIFIRTSTRLGCPEHWNVERVDQLVAVIESSASCQVYPLLKRIDEKYVTERQFMNPKFVEDVARDAAVALRAQSDIRGFSVEVEALESIHAHNAWARYEEDLAE
jgi:GTP cyclohydrolase I